MISATIGILGALIVIVRSKALSNTAKKAPAISDNDALKVSVIVPARNEEHNIGKLLRSLNAVDYPDLEILVVDDQSTDDTFRIASGFGANVIKGSARPPDWGGKQWACHQGAQAATGDILIFTDADTVHEQDSIRKALTYLHVQNLDMLSATPRHTGKTTWEAMTGFFQILLMFAANAFGSQVPGRAYCIGQYIVFKRDAYDSLGGHSTVKNSLVEDVPLANHALENGFRYNILTTENIYSVRMYDSLKSFITGWRRNFRAGLKDSSPLATLEVTLVLGTLLLGGSLKPGIIEMLCFGICVAGMYQLVRRYTDYRILSLIGIPFSLGLFCWITGLAVYDSIFKKKVIWKGRSIVVS